MGAIRLENLVKRYDSGKLAVNNISVNIAEGEVFGFLGPNGAGKTTAVKLLNGMLAPTDGGCEVFGFNPAKSPVEVRAISGVVTEHAQMYGNLTGLENLIFYGKIFGFSESESKSRGLELLEKLELTDAKDRKLGDYSTGMRQRLSLARSMVHRPKVLFLDEPTASLDPESALNVNTIIKDLAKNEGTTIFLCTHQLRYAQDVCSSYGLIDNGQLLASGDLDELRLLVFSGSHVRIEADKTPSSLSAVKIGEQAYTVDVGSEDEIPAIVRDIVSSGGNLFHISSEKASVEEIYFSLLAKQDLSRQGGHGND
ncbi:MAG: ABC transporter ATP-binding protein [Oscillospiraceae bacterium]|nr:ABC transporter ATP-binding protein [Oscillospiraceae bacterium]